MKKKRIRSRKKTTYFPNHSDYRLVYMLKFHGTFVKCRFLCYSIRSCDKILLPFSSDVFCRLRFGCVCFLRLFVCSVCSSQRLVSSSIGGFCGVERFWAWFGILCNWEGPDCFFFCEISHSNRPRLSVWWGSI